MKRINITNRRFGKLVVKEYSPKDGRSVWLCECDCGNIKRADGTSLRCGNIRSCGCLHAESAAKTAIPDAGSAKLKLFNQYKRKAAAKKRSFDLDIHEFLAITSSSCNYCGEEPSQLFYAKSRKYPYKYNGLDRLDNNLGYTIDNAVACCKKCNYAKQDMTEHEFINHIKKILNNYEGA